MTEDEKRGQRVHEIRKALGPNPRRPLSQTDFANRLSETGVRRFYGPEISLIEQGKKPLQIDDLLALAAVDPEQRGEMWIAYGPEGPAQSLHDLLEGAYALTPGDVERAVTIAERAKVSTKEERKARKKKAKPRKHGSA